MSDTISRLNAALEGRYRIERELGAGGMATVYLADDLRHERKVALKVLKPELAAVVGADRFLAEIKTTANLQHPHVLPLFDSGEADSFLFYVMPYVEGESLRERLEREHQLPVDQAVRIATSVAQALDYAHRRGVIHRDIKPANILIHDGQPVVSDFGIALAVSAGGGGRLTETGLSMGTPHYMSPEQATGDAGVGPATDVYSLGCVLYEMLVGEPPYTGSTPQAILGKIIQAESVSATKARRSVPPNVDSAIRKALEKVPADRFGSAADFAHALSDSSFAYGAAAQGASRTPGASSRLAVTFAGTTAILTLALGWLLLRPAAPQPTERHVLSTEGWAGVGSAFGGSSALAPDGSSMILPLDGRLGLKLRGSAEVTPIPGTEGARDVRYSPDSRSIAYAVGANLFRQRIDEGVPERLATDAQPTNRLGLAWLEDGTILYETVDPFQILQIPETGGVSRVVLDPANVWWIEGLPGGQAALVVIQGEPGQLVALGVRDGTTVPLVDDALRAWYADTGHLVWVRTDGTVFAQPFDPGSLQLTGTPSLLFDNVRTSTNRAEMHLASDGTLMYVEGAATAAVQQLVTVDLEGNVEPLPIAASRIGGRGVGWLPDGRTIAYESENQIYTYDVELRQAPRQITFEGINESPVPSPDGTRILFRSDGTGGEYFDLYVKDLRDDSPPRRILEMEYNQTPLQWPVDSLVLFEHNAGGLSEAWLLDLSDPDSPAARPYLAEDGNQLYMTISPDGRLAAYQGNDGSGRRIVLRAFPDPGQPLALLDATMPIWSRDGTALYAFTGANGEMIAARLAMEPVPAIVRIDTLFAMGSVMVPSPAWTLHPDGRRFVVARSDYGGAVETDRLVLVEHFFTELCERVGGC